MSIPRQAVFTFLYFPASCLKLKNLFIITYMAIIAIDEFLKNCHTAIFFMWFWPIIVLDHPSQFLLFKGFAPLHWLLFCCTWRQLLKDPFFFFYSTNISTANNMWIIVLDVLVLHPILRPPLPPPPPVLFCSLFFPPSIPHWCKYLRMHETGQKHCKNLLKIFSLQTSWEERGNRFYRQIGGIWVLYGNIVLAPCEGVREPI